MRLSFNTRSAIASAIATLDSAAFVSVPGDTEAPLSALRAVLDADDEQTAAEVLADPSAVILARISAQHARQRDAAMAERDELAAELAKRDRVYVLGVATLADYDEHDAPSVVFQSWHVAAASPAAALACVAVPAGAEVFIREAAALLLTPCATLREGIALDSFEAWAKHSADAAWSRIAGNPGAVRAAYEARTAAYLADRQAEREAAGKRAAAGFAAMADAVQSFEPEDVPRDADGREVWGTRDATPGRV